MRKLNPVVINNDNKKKKQKTKTMRFKIVKLGITFDNRFITNKIFVLAHVNT